MKVCIKAEDGQFLVYSEQDTPEGGEMESPEEAFASVDEALDAARMMLEGGDAPMEEPEPQMEGEEAFTQGFKQARGGMEF